MSDLYVFDPTNEDPKHVEEFKRLVKEHKITSLEIARLAWAMVKSGKPK